MFVLLRLATDAADKSNCLASRNSATGHGAGTSTAHRDDNPTIGWNAVVPVTM
jgi:hypothetical protein